MADSIVLLPLLATSRARELIVECQRSLEATSFQFGFPRLRLQVDLRPVGCQRLEEDEAAPDGGGTVAEAGSSIRED